MRGKILVACVGNIFLGDDAFGVEVAQELMRSKIPENVVVKDFGIRSYDLAYALMEQWDLVILVDAVSMGREPGTVYTIRPEAEKIAGTSVAPDAHTMNPASVIQMVRAFGGDVGNMLVVGCEPAGIDPDENGQIGLSPQVKPAVSEAIRVIYKLVNTRDQATAA